MHENHVIYFQTTLVYIFNTRVSSTIIIHYCRSRITFQHLRQICMYATGRDWRRYSVLGMFCILYCHIENTHGFSWHTCECHDMENSYSIFNEWTILEFGRPDYVDCPVILCFLVYAIVIMSQLTLIVSNIYNISNN